MSSIDIVRTPEIVAAEINSIKFQTRNVLLFNSIEIGKRLTEAKEMMEHGQFGKWLAEAVDYSQSTANNLMKIYEQYGADQGALFGDNSKSQTFGNLSYSQAVALLGIPAEEREQFIEDNNAAELSIRELKAKIKEYEEKNKQLDDANKNLNNILQGTQESFNKERVKTENLTAQLEEQKEAVKKADTKVSEAWDESEKLKNKVKELEDELNKPATVETAVVEKIPDEVQRELEALRAAVNEKPISDNDAAAKAEIALLFTATKDSFNKMLAAVNLSLEDVYVANIVKCRPPGNRDPHDDEKEACLNYLRYQLAMIHPKIIVCLGRVAAQRLIDPDYRITRQHGTWVERKGCFLTATYHPSALLRDPSKQEAGKRDFQIIREKLREVEG